MKYLIALMLFASCTVYKPYTVYSVNTNCVKVKKTETNWVVFTTSQPVTKALYKAVKKVPGVNKIYRPQKLRYNFSVLIATETFDSLKVVNNIKSICCAKNEVTH